jgi:hypothetical protein
MANTEKTIVRGFRLPESLFKRIDALAKEEMRNQVNMVHVLLEEALGAREAVRKGKKA